MKQLITLALLLLLLLAGCSENSSIISPEDTVKANYKWLNIIGSEEVKLSRVSVTGGHINGATGGNLALNESYDNITIAANLIFPSGAFDGTKHFIYRVDDNKAIVDFLPGASFNKNLTFDITISGITVDGLSNNVIFAYLDNNGVIQATEYSSVTYDAQNKILEVKGAKINHFSRYGWAKSDGTD
jgi:hypothetical protein